MDNFKSNVRESFRRAKDDMVRMQTQIEHLQKEQLALTKQIHELSKKLAVAEVKIRQRK